jgi:hypothetical protein
MRFDPKLIHPDEPPLDAGGELDLPADLTALGQQLGDDAAHLAATYPANRSLASSNMGHDARLRPAWRYARYLAASAAALAALWITAVAWQPQRGARPQPRTATSDVQSSAPHATSPVAAIAGSTQESHVSLPDLSGPELEALLDMLQDDPGRVTSISF